jgi:TIR domain
LIERRAVTDQERVAILQEDLAAFDHLVWFDQRLSGGARWWRAILAELRAADVFLLGVTESSLRSTACIEELHYAEALGKPIIPLRLASGMDPNLAPAPLPSVQWISYMAGDKTDLIALLRAMRECVTHPLPEPLPPDPPVPVSYLAELNDVVRCPTVLDLSAQLLFLHRVEVHLEDPSDRPALVRLLAEFRKRADLLVEVVPTVERLRQRGSIGRTGPEPGPVSIGGDVRHGERVGAQQAAPVEPTADRGPADGGRSPSPADAVQAVTAAFEPYADMSRVFLAPGIRAGDPARVHARFPFEPGESLVVVIEQALFRTGGSSFIALTDRRLLYKHGSTLRSVLYSDLRPAIIYTSSDGGFRIGPDSYAWNWIGEFTVQTLVAALRNIARTLGTATGV